MTSLRAETLQDQAAVHRVDKSASGRMKEANPVDALRGLAQPHLSLVAVDQGQIVGHVFFSPIIIEVNRKVFTAIAFLPAGPCCLSLGEKVSARSSRDRF
jgi:putative acetyltransferase